jgi:hypothetical protein
MSNSGSPNPFDSLCGLRWQPQNGEIQLETIPPGTKIHVVQRGVFITDDQGKLITRNEKDIQVFSNLINHIWELYIIPELNKRKELAQSPPIPLSKVMVLFTQTGNMPIVIFNNEYGLKARVIKRRGIGFNAGDLVGLNQIVDIEYVEPPKENGIPKAFIIINFDGAQISLFADFRPNNLGFTMDDWRDEGEWLADAYVEKILAKQFGHLAIVIPEVTTMGIPFTIGLRPDKMRLLIDAVRDGTKQEKIDVAVENICRDEMESIIESWMNLVEFSDRFPLLKETLIAWKNKLYGAVVVLLMSQIEGILTELLVKNKKGLNKIGQAVEWKVRLKEFNNLMISCGIGPMRRRMLRGVVYFLDKSTLYDGFSWNSTTGRVNRHACLHGKDCSYNTPANAIRMILLFDAIHWILYTNSISKKQKDNTL